LALPGTISAQFVDLGVTLDLAFSAVAVNFSKLSITFLNFKSLLGYISFCQWSFGPARYFRSACHLPLRRAEPIAVVNVLSLNSPLYLGRLPATFLYGHLGDDLFAPSSCYR
jgi:glucose uptake protein GlcU